MRLNRDAKWSRLLVSALAINEEFKVTNVRFLF